MLWFPDLEKKKKQKTYTGCFKDKRVNSSKCLEMCQIHNKQSVDIGYYYHSFSLRMERIRSK